MHLAHLTALAGLAQLAACLEKENAAPGNWSVRLMHDLRPDEVHEPDWIVAVDTMITKAEPYSISDWIENLSITHSLPESTIRTSVNTERTHLSLPLLPPFALPPNAHGLLDYYRARATTTTLSRSEKAAQEREAEELRNYLPKGWTDEMYRKKRDEDVEKLTDDEKERLKKRAEQRTLDVAAKINTEVLELMPQDIIRSITASLHEQARIAAGKKEGVRVYKRNVSALAQVVEVTGLERFGYLLYRTWYADGTTRGRLHWKRFLRRVEETNEVGLNGTARGRGGEVIREKFVFAVAEDEKGLEGAGVEEIRRLYTNFQKTDPLPAGLVTGIVLVADQDAIESIAGADSSRSEQPAAFVWAVDVTYDPDVNEYPQGYRGRFKVHPSALLHDLYVSLAVGAMQPVDVWALLRVNQVVEGGEGKGEEGERGDGEEVDAEGDEDESWMHEEL